MGTKININNTENVFRNDAIVNSSLRSSHGSTAGFTVSDINSLPFSRF